jgi:hypothetical protein
MTQLEQEKLMILAEAEQSMLQDQLTGNEMDDMKRIEHEAATSLVSYLKEIESAARGERKEDISGQTGHKCQQNQEEMFAMIAALRKPSKKARRIAKKQIVAISHDVEKQRLFEIVKVSAPQTIEEVSTTLHILQDKVRNYMDSLDGTRIAMEMSPVEEIQV